MPNPVKCFRYVKKHFLLQVSDWCQIIYKFCELLRAADAHMNHWARSFQTC